MPFLKITIILLVLKAHATKYEADKCWLCQENMDENKTFTYTCGHAMHRQCARDLDHSNGYLNSLKCGLCRKVTIGLAELYAGTNGCQIYVNPHHENKDIYWLVPLIFIDDFKIKFRDVKQMAYWQKRISLEGPYSFFYCRKKMDDNSTLESANVKKESTLHWMPDKKKIFDMQKNKIIQKYRNENAMVFKLSDLDLDPFTIPLNSNTVCNLQFTLQQENGLKNIKLYFPSDDGYIYVTYEYNSRIDRYLSNMLIPATQPFETFYLKNICVSVFPSDKQIEIREIDGKQFILEIFKNVEFFSCRSGNGGNVCLFQNFQLLPDSMKHQIKRKFWKKKYKLKKHGISLLLMTMSIWLMTRSCLEILRGKDKSSFELMSLIMLLLLSLYYWQSILNNFQEKTPKCIEF